MQCSAEYALDETSDCEDGPIDEGLDSNQIRLPTTNNRLPIHQSFVWSRNTAKSCREFHTHELDLVWMTSSRHFKAVARIGLIQRLRFDSPYVLTYSQAMPSPSRSSFRLYPGCPMSRGALPAALTAVQFA